MTFTICTGNEDDRRLALETLEGIKRLREELPGVGLILGVSNVSFGLNPAARHVLNSVFLHHATEAGLTAAILHAARIEPLHRIDARVREVAEDLIFDRRREGYDPLQEYLKLFEGVDVKKKAARVVPEDVLERLRWRIVEGERPGLEDDLLLALERKTPLAIVNEDLLAGMAVVGELFGRGDMQLPFVLQSAETMKAAVAFLEPHMERASGESRGRIVLATVRGDVHDIGKNLVDIILTNNGYTVFNLGIKQPIQKILEIAHEHRPHAIGMSGLLVKSTVIMKENLEEMNRRGVTTPVILGGAALTRAYVEDDCRRAYNGALVLRAGRLRGPGRDGPRRGGRDATRGAADHAHGTRRARARPGELRARGARGAEGRRPRRRRRRAPRPAREQGLVEARRAAARHRVPQGALPRRAPGRVDPAAERAALHQRGHALPVPVGLPPQGQGHRALQEADPGEGAPDLPRARQAVRQGADPRLQGGLRLLEVHPRGRRRWCCSIPRTRARASRASRSRASRPSRAAA